ncbi:hypothetical protein J1605_021382 [Eschrichtius robustus]|uniref:Uncharacterized protein n=1 Tax=Eschrichtius robustus TaxID=9764 RepID=A0AB34HHR3_ESCRO|nr:hypothetical protein J1605_021382 [Eschrichtius robustus]
MGLYLSAMWCIPNTINLMKVIISVWPLLRVLELLSAEQPSSQ